MPMFERPSKRTIVAFSMVVGDSPGEGGECRGKGEEKQRCQCLNDRQNERSLLFLWLSEMHLIVEWRQREAGRVGQPHLDKKLFWLLSNCHLPLFKYPLLLPPTPPVHTNFNQFLPFTPTSLMSNNFKVQLPDSCLWVY
ncbi:hypothetical protein L6452_26015 [Arctium lappa]|uniref:Uncharacterized protein n=1 Tax=Arctium lappa TaxID=4217 RepID=A0ACB9AB86_ARCLA|nr:hypothetical protein L6452_26015 [Arctium lappa]